MYTVYNAKGEKFDIVHKQDYLEHLQFGSYFDKKPEPKKEKVIKPKQTMPAPTATKASVTAPETKDK